MLLTSVFLVEDTGNVRRDIKTRNGGHVEKAEMDFLSFIYEMSSRLHLARKPIHGSFFSFDSYATRRYIRTDTFYAIP